MRKLLLAGALAVLASPAWAAAPTCGAGQTTIIAGSSGTATLAQLSNNNCVQIGDKIFGSASVGGAIAGTGAAGFSINVGANSTTVVFLGTVQGPPIPISGNINYSVAVAANSTDRITAFQQDITIEGINASATLVGGIDINLNCTNTTDGAGNASPGGCPISQQNLANLQNLSVSQTVTVNTAATTVNAITDTIFQTAIPEPGSLLILGTALAGLGLVGWKRRRFPLIGGTVSGT